MNDAAKKVQPKRVDQAYLNRLNALRDLNDAIDAIARMLVIDAERGVFDDIEAKTAQGMIDNAVRLRDLMGRR